MNYLLDTNTISELTKAQPAPAVVAWIRRYHDVCFLSSITVGELTKGLEALPEGKRKNRLARDLRFLLEDYRDRVLPYDELTAVTWGRLYASAAKKNRVLALEDSMIEAIALSHRLTLATRNAKDFFRVPTTDPWQFSEPPPRQAA